MYDNQQGLKIKMLITIYAMTQIAHIHLYIIYK